MSGERKSEKSGVLEHYLALPQPEDRVQCTYVWIDGTGESLRSKTKTVNFIPKTPKELPVWSFDGSCSYLAEGNNSDVYLHPVALYRDPFRLVFLYILELFQRIL